MASSLARAWTAPVISRASIPTHQTWRAGNRVANSSRQWQPSHRPYTGSNKRAAAGSPGRLHSSVACFIQGDAGRSSFVGSSGLAPLRTRCPPARRAMPPSRSRRRGGVAVPRAEASAEASKFFPPMMTRPDWKWRVLAMLAYTMPLTEGLYMLSGGDLARFGWIAELVGDLSFEVLVAYGTFTWFPIALFFLLFFKVVHNRNLPHFLRYHTLQSIMIEMVFSLHQFSAFLMPLAVHNATAMMAEFVMGIICLFTASWSVYYAARGMYADIPFVSDAVLIQLPVGAEAVNPDQSDEQQE